MMRVSHIGKKGAMQVVVAAALAVAAKNHCYPSYQCGVSPKVRTTNRAKRISSQPLYALQGMQG
jgi:hypothetical protein